MNTRATFVSAPFLVVCALLVLAAGAIARQSTDSKRSKDGTIILRSLVLDGSPVHNVGELHLHTGNWGAFGSMPTSAAPFSFAPSAEWPGGSGVEHLYVAGLWIGALKNQVPAVSTAAYEMEFRPTSDPTDVVYYAAEGDPGGKRLPDANADDDADGMIDEEWLDGHDNDLDGQVDEDFAAISNQMQSCWYTDDQPGIGDIYPNHNPMHLLVRQRSFQWSDPDFDDFVGFDYTIINNGTETLEDIYVGVFLDADVGNRNTPNYWEDDAAGYEDVSTLCTVWGGATVDYAYVYDLDGDAGQTTSRCGIVPLGHVTDPTGQLAPPEVRWVTYASFAGSQSYEDGGDPTNDFERYELLSSQTIERDAAVPRDYRVLAAVGPFAELAPGETLTFQMAIFAGDAPGGVPISVAQHAAAAKLTYEGRWFDLDGDPTTGVEGRETPIAGPASNVVVDACQSPPVVIPYVPPGQIVWVNDDCAQEELFKTTCGYGDADSMMYRTGVGGKESQVHWIPPSDVYIPVLITRFDAKALRSSARVTWELFADEEIQGFRILRSLEGEAPVVLPSSSELISPTARSFTDDGVTPGRSYRYTLVVVFEDGSTLSSPAARASIPARLTQLHPNYPNPFNPATTISFTLAEKSLVNVSVYSPDGKRVVTLANEVLPGGLNEVSWDGKDASGNYMSSGVYFCRLTSGKTTLSQKMVYLK